MRAMVLDRPGTPRLVEGVVAGIAGYGNSMGIPTVGGEIYFEALHANEPMLDLMREVVAVGPPVGSEVQTLQPGQKVAVEPNYSCGVCPLCREGNRNLCLSRTAIGIDVHGGFAEQACLPARCCWPAPARPRAPALPSG